MRFISICLLLGLLYPICQGLYIGLNNSAQLPCTTADMVQIINQLRTNYTWAINLVNSSYPESKYPQSPLVTSDNKELYLVQTLRITIETSVKNGSLKPMQSFDAHNAFAGWHAHLNAYYRYTSHFGCCWISVFDRLRPFGLVGPVAQGIWPGISPFTCEQVVLDMLMSDLEHRGPFFYDHPYVGIGFGGAIYTQERDAIWIVFEWYDANSTLINQTYVNQPEVLNWLNHYVQNVSCPAGESWPGLNGTSNPNQCVNGIADPIFLSDGTCYGVFHTQLTTNVTNMRMSANTSSTLDLLNYLKSTYPDLWGEADPAASTLVNLTSPFSLNISLSQFACQYAKAKMTNSTLPAIPAGMSIFSILGLSVKTNLNLQILAILQGGKFFYNYQSYGYGIYYNSNTAIIVSVLFTNNPNNVNPPLIPLSALRQPVYRFYSSTTKNHYLSLNSSVENAASFGFPTFQKIAFYTLVENLPGTTPLSRLHFKPAFGGSYPYTVDASEQDAYLNNTNYVYDGDLGYVSTAPLVGAVPLYLYEHPVRPWFHMYEWFPLINPGLESLYGYTNNGILAYVYQNLTSTADA